MGHLDIAKQCDMTASTLLPTFLPTNQVSETILSGPTVTCNCENMVWTELTYKDRTFEFNHGLHIRAIKEDGGWAFKSDNPELMGFGHTRSEAELVFCLDFASCWDDLACEDDEKLTQDAIEMKRVFLDLVKSQR